MNDPERIRAAPPERLAALFGQGFPAAVAGDLARMPRFRTRLTEAARRRLGELPRLDPRQSSALALEPEGLLGLALRAGAIWHAAALARVISSEARRGLTATLGPDVYAIALEGRGLAPPGQPSDMALEALVQAVPTEGQGCLAAWRARQPAPVAARLSLFDRDASPEAVHHAFGPPIVDWLLDRR